MDEQLAHIRSLLANEKAQEAKTLFLDLEEQDNVAYYLLKGAIEQKFQQWGEAMNAFNRVLELDPGNEDAVNSLHLIQNILNFWNPEMFNP